jgi:hypothetical protein
VHPAGVPEDAHGRRQADGTRPGPHLSDAPHTVRHEVSQNSVKIRQKIHLDLLLYLWISVSDPNSIRSLGPYPESGFNQVTGSVSGIRIQSGQWIRIRNPDSIRSLDPYPESGSRRAKMTHKNRIFFQFHVSCSFLGLKASSVAWTSFMEA